MADDLPPEAMNEIIELIGDHQKIAAVKLYKDLRNTSLADAKKFIEELTEKLRVELPESFVSSSELNELTQLIYAGKKIQAIKHFRLQQTSSLYDAKRFIEQLTEDLKQKYPEKFSSRSTTGCAAALAWVAITLSATGIALVFVVTIVAS